MNQAFNYEAPTPIVSLPTQVIVAPSAIRARDPSLPFETQFQLLAMQYRHVTLQDALASGNAFYDPLKQSWAIYTKRPVASFKGLVFEAMLARLCREHPDVVGRRALAWCTNRTVGRVTDKMVNEYIPFITADSRLQNRPLTATFYNPGSPFDLQFYRVNEAGAAELARQVDTGALAGIQAKAIQGDERSEVIDPVLSGRYPHVLTMLKHKTGEHSYEVCRRLLTAMSQKGEITHEQALDALNRITYPGALGIDQGYIEDYSEYINISYKQQVQLRSDYIEAIALEVSENLTTSPGGILVPARQDLILPPTL
ncbi:hypothetical protein [Burkholderia cepacia]|uniref:Uncharacterized protein n=1 Tax=Burkholderia cepacia GG4 TaxID=1009846 RepID=A0A9W3K6L6_BURCE|nr:hypothetical protein [Burkholderia cepacia]AFQ50433.1 hypothetical protein GEM_4043 [Burkholderia cepacia GG4]